MKSVISTVLSSVLVLGCEAPPTSTSLIWPVYEPLANGQLVTVEVIHVNGSECPGQSMKEAIDGFSKYVAGEVRTVQGKPVTLEADSAGLLTEAQLTAVIANRRYSGPSDITIIVVPGLCDFPNRGFLRYEVGGSHTVVIQADRVRARVPPLVSRKRWAHLVIKHELCHALRVPADASHEWSDGHCTRPDCILYPRPDAKAMLSAALHLGPPMDLCTLCQQEIREAQLRARGELVRPDQPYDSVAWLNTVVELNPDNPRTLLSVAERCYVETRYRLAVAALNEHVRLNPDDARALNFFAWILATCTNEDIRDGARAIQLAERACSLTKWRNHAFVDTLAAAYAEAGQFDEAIEHQMRAISMADETSTEGYGQRLKSYQERRR